MTTTDSLRARLAANVIHLRRARGLTQADAARSAGMAESTYRTIEYGRGNATLASLVALARALEVQPTDLLAPVPAK